MLDITGFSYAWPDAPDWSLKDVSLQLAAGQCCCLTGPTGSGKSTLALACKGLLPVSKQAGSIRFASEQPRVGLVMQNPESQLFATTLGEEVAFALENQGVAPAQMVAQVEAAVAAVGLELSLEHPVANMSMGQKYRVLLAAVLVMRPEVLILDEPAAQLDRRGLNDLRQVLQRLRRQGVAVLLCEHRPQAFTGLIDHCWQLDSAGRLVATAFSAAEVASPPLPDFANNFFAKKTLVEVDSLAAGIDQTRPIWRNATFTVSAGERVFVQGANGTGKSTLLRLLTGLSKPLAGSVKVFGQQPTLRKVRGRLGMLMQNPQRQLFADTVIDEVAFSLKQSGLSREEQRGRAIDVLSCCGIADLAERSPHQLSYGQKHLVALAAVLASEPQLLLLDDPFAGLDQHYQQAVWLTLQSWNREQDTAIVWTSHHQEEVPAFADQLISIEEGQLVCRSVIR